LSLSWLLAGKAAREVACRPGGPLLAGAKLTKPLMCAQTPAKGRFIRTKQDESAKKQYSLLALNQHWA
jgi:hypothetical protein